jgi:hypothetical protein
VGAPGGYPAGKLTGIETNADPERLGRIAETVLASGTP